MAQMQKIELKGAKVGFAEMPLMPELNGKRNNNNNTHLCSHECSTRLTVLRILNFSL